LKSSLVSTANGLLSIGEVAGSVGLRASAIRYYEEIGLVRPAARVSGQRRYEPTAVDQLRFIGFCQGLGFSLAEIRQLVTPPTGKSAKQRWRELVDHKLGELAAVIARARQVERILEVSRDCDCVSLDACRLLRDCERAITLERPSLPGSSPPTRAERAATGRVLGRRLRRGLGR